MRATHVLAICLGLFGCAPSAEQTCEAFVHAWAGYELRCGTLTSAPTDRPVEDEDREAVEEAFFGSEDGCEQVTADDFRDPRALREECPAELDGWPCDRPYLPEPCADQIRR